MMTEQRNPHIDRSKWGRGPWDDEPDHVRWTDAATGLPCLARRTSGGYWCGYVAVPPAHPMHGADYDTPSVEVHGELTYAASCDGDGAGLGVCHVPADGEPDDAWWFGFDCAHGGDYRPADIGFGLRSHGKYRTLDYVRAQCTDLARQLAEVAHA